MSVFLTGGTGLIGSHVADLLRSRGTEVVCLQRPSSDTSFLRSIGCEIRQGDVRDDPDVTVESMEGCRAVVHCAAVIYVDQPWPRVRAVNVTGTERILTAARRAGAERAVHVSSVAVYGSAEGRVDEDARTDTPLRPGDLYARSKREAEEVAMEIHERGKLDVTILRPGAVYGERDRLFVPRVAGIIRWPVTPLLGDGSNTIPAVYAGNLAGAVIRALTSEEAPGRAYNVATDEPLTQRRFLEGLAAGMNEPVRFVSLPGGLVRRLAEVGELLGVSLPEARDLGLRRGARLASRDNPFVSGRIRRELGWEPEVEVEEALKRTGAWIGEEGVA